MGRGVAVVLLLVALPLCVVGSQHFIHLVVLAAAGLAGLYMMHLLAKDWNNYNKITHPAAKLLFKRHARADQTTKTSSNRDAVFLAATRARLRRAERLDPRGCASRLVCQLAATPSQLRRPYQDDLLLMIRNSNLSRQIDGFQLAADLGYQSKNQTACYEFFNKCPFQTAQLLNVIEPSSAVFTSNTLI